MKTVEEIRHELGLSQIKFAEMLGVSLRTYQLRLSQQQPMWTIYELIAIYKHYKGKIKLQIPEGEYMVDIKEIN